MHDDLGQLLAAMKLELGTLRQRLPAQPDDALQAINNLSELVDTMALSVRRIIADLPPKALEDFGLFCALEMLTENFQKRHHIFVYLKKPSPEPLMRSNLKTPIYRMIQEALNNIAKHARATEVEVLIVCCNGFIDLVIRDNGTGMAPDSMQKPDSFGLLGMQQRTAALGGQFSIGNIPGSGTEIHILIPLRPRNSETGDGHGRP
jgi:signal transduction histidine kinase